MSQKQPTLSDYITLAGADCNPSVPPGITEIIATQRMVVVDARLRIEEEGLVVRNLKGDVIPHPAIKIMNEAQKIESGLLGKYGKTESW